MNDLSNPEHKTEKISDWLLLREANIEIGKLKSLIQELESEIESYKKLSKAEKQRIKLTETYKNQQRIIAERNIQIRELRKTNDKLMNHTFLSYPNL